MATGEIAQQSHCYELVLLVLKMSGEQHAV